jgi:hypothetical protein
MSEKPVCRRCGYVGPVDARYCARCGRALVPPGVRLTRSIDRILSSLRPLHVGLLGLVLLVPIGVFADRLIGTRFSFPSSLVLLALVIGCGYAYLGWQWNTPLSGRSRLERMLLVSVCVGILLAVVRLIDRALLSAVADSGHTVVYDIPGVYVEASAGVRRLSIGNVPPYWLAVMIYAVLTAVAGNLIHRVHERRSM